MRRLMPALSVLFALVTLGSGGAAGSTALAATTSSLSHAASPTLVAPAALPEFFAAARLDASAFPAGLTRQTDGPISADALAADVGPGAADALAGSGLLGAYAQGYSTTSLVVIGSGRPAAAGVLIAVFDTADDAASWFTFETANSSSIGAQLAGNQGASFTITDVVQLPLSLGGDQSLAVDVQGSATLSGITIPVHIALGLMQRGPVISSVVVAATQDQSAAMASLAGALDANVAAALPLLAQ